MSTPSTTSPPPPPRRHQTTAFLVLPPPTNSSSSSPNNNSYNNNKSPNSSSPSSTKSLSTKTIVIPTTTTTTSTLPLSTSPQQQLNQKSSPTTGTSPPTLPSRMGRERSGGMVSSPPPPLPPRTNLRSKTTIGNTTTTSTTASSSPPIACTMIPQHVISATNVGMSVGMNIGGGVITNGQDGNLYVKSTVKSENKPSVTIVHRVPQPSKASSSSDPNLTELKKVSIHLTSANHPSNTTTSSSSSSDGPLDSKTLKNGDSPQTHSNPSSMTTTTTTTTTPPPPLNSKSSLPKLNLQQVSNSIGGPTVSPTNNNSQHSPQKRDTDESMHNSSEQEDDTLSVHDDEGVAVPSKLPPPPPPRKKVKTEEEKELERKELRWEVIAEIIKTEENYVEGLNHLERFYIKPLRALGSDTQHIKPVITQKDLSYIFDKMTVIKSVNEGFLKQLKMLDLSFETQDDPTKSIGLFFKRTLPMFKVYTDYVNNYNSIAARVKDMMKENPSFDSYMNEMERNARKQGKVGFFSYMIQPVQRLPRYTLLVNELLKHTPETHPDYKNLCDACELSKQVSSHVNSAMNVLQNQLKMTEINSSILKLDESIGSTFIKPSRTFVLEGEDFLVSEYALGKKAKKANKCTVYLLSDLILITKKGKYLNHVYLKNELNLSTFKHPWLFYDLENNKQEFEIISDEATYVIVCPTAIACNEWIEKINQNTCCNAAPGKEIRANRLTHSKIRKVANEENMYIIDFENNDYCMCYSPKDKCTIKISKKDVTIRDATTEDETTFGVSLDEDSNDDRTTVSSETTDSQIFGENNITHSTSISDFSMDMSEEDRTLKSPRSARGFNPLRGLQDLKVFSSRQKLTTLSAGKPTLNGEDKVHDIHSIISASVDTPTDHDFHSRRSLQSDTPFRSDTIASSSSHNRQSLIPHSITRMTDGRTLNHSHPQLSPRNLTEDYVPTLPIIKKNPDFLQTIEERKKTLIRRDPPVPLSPGNNNGGSSSGFEKSATSTRPPWLAELEGKKLSKVIPGEQDYVYSSPKTPVQ